LYPKMEKNLFRCIPQRKKTSFVVSHNGGKYLPLWDTTEEKSPALWVPLEKNYLPS
jgi:hypothetical protein